MARFSNLPPAVPSTSSYGIGNAPTREATYEGGAGFAPSDPHMELFNAAVSGMLADQFYESGNQRVERLVALVPQCDPEWLTRFIPWLRDVAHLRSAPIVLSAEYARAQFPGSRQVVASALKRPDEPGEMLGYWISRYGRNVPSRVKRGIADAVTRLYNENALLRYDGASKAWRFGDVIEFVHPKPSAQWQDELFKFALDRRRHSNELPPDSLKRTFDTLTLERLVPDQRRQLLKYAVDVGFSWERLAGWLPGGMDREAWEAVIPNMGYMALMRNLNNFDRSGVTPGPVLERLTEPGEILGSKVLPFRFLTAYLNLEADTYKVALSSAADVAVRNLPEFKGSTIIMVDCSGSMQGSVGAGRSRSPLALSQAAGFMAEALGRACEEAAIACYDTQVMTVASPQRHVGVLRASSDVRYRPQGGTRTWDCTREVYSKLGGADRIVIITDEQSSDSDTGAITCPVVTWNLAGYRTHHAHHGGANRFLVAGYNDTALQVLPSVIATGDGHWPF